MIDRRYQHLVAVHNAPGVDAERRCALGLFAEAVLERTGCRVLFDVKYGSLFLHLAHDITQGLQLPPPMVQLRHGSGWDWSILDKLDVMCRLVRSARVSWSVRDWMGGYATKSTESARKAATRAEVEAMSDEIKATYKFYASRVGMHSRYTRGVVVNGLKGG